MRMASIHHHFPNKEALRNARLDSYPERFTHELERRLNPTEYRESFVGGLGNELMPLCGATAGDAASLPTSICLLPYKSQRIFRAGVTD
jgi:TetR/AcrR family transcriptional regulator, transcriptional repressor for nem operon